MGRAIDLFVTYRFLKLLTTPFEKQDAFKLGIIDKDGKVLKKYTSLKKREEKNAYTQLHRFVFNLKRILKRVGLGGRLGSFAVALGLLIKEDKSYINHKDAIESGVISYLKENNLIDKYDRFVLTRSDYLHTHEIPVDNESILIPAFEFHGGVTDRFAIIPQKFLEKFLRIGTYIVKEPGTVAHIFNNNNWPLGTRIGKHWGWNLETYIFIFLNITGLWESVKFFAPTMFTVMTKKNDRFKNEFNEEYNCYLRYQTEFRYLSDTPGKIFDSKKIDFFYLEDDMFIGKLI